MIEVLPEIENVKKDKQFTSYFYRYVTRFGSRTEQILKDNKVKLLQRYIKAILFLCTFYFFSAILSNALFWSFKNIILSAIPLVISVLPCIFCILFINFLRKVKREFNDWQRNNNGKILESCVFRAESKYHIVAIYTSIACVLGSSLIFLLNLTKILSHKNILNITLPAALVLVTFFAMMISQVFGKFLSKMSGLEINRREDNVKLYSFESVIKLHEWPRLRKINSFGNKTANGCNSVLKAIHSNKFKFASMSEEFSREGFVIKSNVL